ncbi:MAG TPA: hypothetical protein VLK30_08875 [Candidatus Limnocylindrales bacterium]|nr:hypothetical protein [Candidatus Limnocylindrales bacterium]
MRIAGAFTILFLLAACGGVTHGPPLTSGSDKLFEATAGHIVVIDSRSHATDRTLPLGVPSADWKHLYSIAGTNLFDTNPASGATATTIPLGGKYVLPAATIGGLPGGLSPNGRWLVAESYDGAAGAVPTSSRLLIVDTIAARPFKTIDLAGYFHYDAISNDGMRLYLIQYLDGREYYVRLYDVVTGTLDENIVVDKSNGEQSMSGQRLSGVAAPAGNWLYSMYVRQDANPFIHALSLDGPFAFCLDLPGNGYAGNEAERHWSLAMNTGGTRLYAVNGATGLLAVVDSSQEFNPQIVRTQHIAGGKPAAAGANAAVLSSDGRSLVTAGATGIVWVDTGSLAVRMHALDGWNVWSLALSPDGATVYAVRDNGQISAVSMSSGSVTSTFDPTSGRPLALMRVASA